MVHCERCGARCIPVSGMYDYCVVCGLYVCSACWDARGFCADCSRSLGRRTVARDARMLRKADRRLRETVRETDVVRRKAGGRRIVPAAMTEMDRGFLELKIGAAERVRGSVMGGRMTRARRDALLALAERIDRHARLARRSVDGTARLGLPHEAGLRPVRVERIAAIVAGLSIRYSGLVVVALLLVAVGIASWDDDGPIAGEVLSGRPTEGLPSPSADPSAPDAAPSGTPMAEQLTFDDERIGPIADGRWGKVNDLVRIAAYPTPFDRSIEVRTHDGEPAEACFSPAPTPFLVQGLSVDVFVPSTGSVGATVTLASGSGDAELVIEMGTSAVTVTSGGRTLASEPGIVADRWHRVRLDSAADGIAVALGAPVEDGPSASRQLGISSLRPVARICFGAAGQPGISVYFDNLAVGYQASPEG